MKKVLVIILMCLTLGLIGIGAYFIFELNKQEHELPTNLQIYEIDDKFYAFCNAKEGETYIYKIEQNFSQNENEEFFEVLLLETDTNMICLNDYDEIILNLGEYLRISVCYKGETESGNSKFTKPIVWEISYILDTPQIRNENSTIVWDKVENAEYYTIYYQFKDGELKTMTTTETFVDTSTLFGGVYNVCVEAHSSKSYYKTSEVSEFKTLTIRRQVQPFLYVVYDNRSFTLTVTSKEIVNVIKVLLNENGSSYEFDDAYFTHTIDSNGLYQYTITRLDVFGFKGDGTVSGYFDEYNTWSTPVIIQ